MSGAQSQINCKNKKGVCDAKDNLSIPKKQSQLLSALVTNHLAIYGTIGKVMCDFTNYLVKKMFLSFGAPERQNNYDSSSSTSLIKLQK